MHRRSFLKALGGSAIALGSATKIVEALALEPLPVAKEPWGNAFVFEVFHNDEWKSILGVRQLAITHNPIEVTTDLSEFREFIDGPCSAEITGIILPQAKNDDARKLVHEAFYDVKGRDMRMATMTHGIIFEKANIISFDISLSYSQPVDARIELSYEKYTTTRLED